MSKVCSSPLGEFEFISLCVDNVINHESRQPRPSLGEQGASPFLGTAGSAPPAQVHPLILSARIRVRRCAPGQPFLPGTEAAAESKALLPSWS